METYVVPNSCSRGLIDLGVTIEPVSDLVRSSNLTGTMPNKKGTKNQVPFYLVRLGAANVLRKASLCVSRTPTGFACGPGENYFFWEGPSHFGAAVASLQISASFAGSSNSSL
jgi:hypothetical protein